MKNILFVASEANPYAGTGGLGDVIGSLPAALASENSDLDVRVVIPMHVGKISEEYRNAMTKVCEFDVPLSWRSVYCGVYSLTDRGVTWYFIDNEYYFNRSKLYGEYDDGERYAFFSKAVLEMLPYINFVPDILHANDWQSALSVIYLKKCYPQYETKAIYTIHNIEYQGKYSFGILGDVFDLPNDLASTVEYDGCINLTKGAIVCADKVTTVSSRYAEEIGTEFYSHGLHYIIWENREKVCGIVNGIDLSLYDPEDPTLPAPFSVDDTTGKETCKVEIQRRFGLPESPTTPLIVMISRLATHKGFDLVKCILEEFLQEDVQVVLLGTGEREYEEFFSWIATRYPSKAATMLAYNKNLAKLLYAGGDIFLMPSLSEPCGLAQMMASRYGTVPVVRETGGLADTIHPYNPTTGEGNGVNFVSYNAHHMLDALRRAVDLYNKPEEWAKLRRNAMTYDFSWSKSAKMYLEMYAGLF